MSNMMIPKHRYVCNGVVVVNDTNMRNACCGIECILERAVADSR